MNSIRNIIDPEGKMSLEEYKVAYKRYWNQKNRAKAKSSTPAPVAKEEFVKKDKPVEPEPKKPQRGEPEVKTSVSSGSIPKQQQPPKQLLKETLKKEINPEPKPTEIDRDTETTSYNARTSSAHNIPYKRSSRSSYKRREFDLLGAITEREARQARQHFRGCMMGDNGRVVCVENCYFGRIFYVLKIKCENEPQVTQVKVFDDKVDRQLWEAVTKREYIDKRLLLICNRNGDTYKLVDWKEVPKHE